MKKLEYRTTKLLEKVKRRLKAFASAKGYRDLSSAVEALLDSVDAPQVPDEPVSRQENK